MDGREAPAARHLQSMPVAQGGDLPVADAAVHAQHASTASMNATCPLYTAYQNQRCRATCL